MADNLSRRTIRPHRIGDHRCPPRKGRQNLPRVAVVAEIGGVQEIERAVEIISHEIDADYEKWCAK